MSKYGAISGPYFPVFSLNAGKYGPEITLYLDTFHVVFIFLELLLHQTMLTYSSFLYFLDMVPIFIFYLQLFKNRSKVRLQIVCYEQQQKIWYF